MLIQCNVDRTKYSKKPSNYETSIIQNNLTTPTWISTHDLAAIVVNGGSMRICACYDGCNDEAFQTGQLLGIDTDNKIKIRGKGKVISKNPFHPEDVRRVLAEHGIKVNFQYYTWSDGVDGVPQFRTIIALDRPVNNISEYRALLQYIINLFDEFHADRGAETVSRIFYGTGTGKTCFEDFEAVNSTDALLEKCGDISEYTPSKSISKSKKKKSGKSRCENYVNLNVVEAIKKHDVKELKKKISAPKVIVDNRSELRNYIYHELDLSELLDVQPDKAFHCVLPGHPDHHESASVFQNKSGVWLYCCHAGCQSDGKGKTVLNLKQFIELVGDFKSEFQSMKFICEIFNITLQQTSWSREQQENIDSILSSLTDVDGIDSFNQLCPTASVTTRNALETYLKILIIAKDAISPQRNAEGNIIFSMSVRQLAKAVGKTESKTAAYIKLLAYHHLLEPVSDADVPPRMLARAIEHAHIAENGKRCNHAAFYSIPSWVVNHIILVEGQGRKWKEYGYRLKGVSFEMFARCEPAEAKRLYPQSNKYMMHNGNIVDRRPSLASDKRHEEIAAFVLSAIESCGYCTEKMIVEAFTNKDLTTRQICRSMREICDSYGLVKRRCDKELKALYNIDSVGYPNVIIRE